MSHEQQNKVVGANRFPFILNWVGGILSCSLIAGLIYWVALVGPYDPNSVPVIEPLKGLARVEPENPGGALADNQGLAVNAVASDAANPVLEDQVRLAPDTITLDMAQTVEQVLDTTAPDIPVVNPVNAVGLSSSPKPFLRPVNLKTEIAATTSLDVTQQIVAGTKLIQLGAYPSQASAEKEWDKLSLKHGDLLSGKAKFIMVADTSNGRFYRLRASGFADGGQSAALCVALKARDVPCFPVTAK